MNIFAVHQHPVQAARMLPDRHVTKMILESAQMLRRGGRTTTQSANILSTADLHVLWHGCIVAVVRMRVAEEALFEHGPCLRCSRADVLGGARCAFGDAQLSTGRR